MNHAPAVQYPVGRSVWARRFLWSLLALWLLTQAGWLLVLRAQSWPGAWWFSTLAAVGVLVWSQWHQKQPLLGTLHWQPFESRDAPNGQGGVWRWYSAGYRHGTDLPGLERLLDGQRILLLRGRTQAGLTLWLWLEADAEPSQWNAMRRALRAHQRP